MTRCQKRRRKYSKDNASTSAIDSSRPASLGNDVASAIDSTAASASVLDSSPASWDKGAASASASRPASKDNGTASMLDPRAASQENAPAYAVISRSDSKEDASASALHSRPVSSFEFSVTSEEGINLYVDMNSSLVDWHKKLENGMCICRCVEESEPQSFREQLLYLGNSRKEAHDSFGWKSENRIKDSNSSFVSSPNSLNKNGDDGLLSHRDEENGPSEIFAAAACSSAQEDSNCLEEHKEHPASISSNSGIISRTGPGKRESVDPNAFHVHKGKIAACSMESLINDRPQTTPNNKKLYGEVSTSVKIKMQQNKKDVTPLCVSSVNTAIRSDLSEVCCLENNPASLSFLDDSSQNLSDADHSMETGAQELAKSSVNESHTHSNILPAEGKVMDGPVKETEASCKSGKIMSDGGHRRKVCKSQLDKVSPQLSRRILRSAVRPRRSRRLFSKAVTP